MTPVTDWKGNVIKEGDEICWVKIIDRDYVGGVMFFNLHGDNKYETRDKEPDKDCWEPGKSYKVISQEDKLGHMQEVKSWSYSNQKLKWSDSFLKFISLYEAISWLNDNTHILSIKGVSDNEQEYRDSQKSKP